MGTYDGGQATVDSSSWKRGAASHKNGEPQPAPAPMEQTATGMKRTTTPDPYASDSPDVRRNFGRS